MNGRYYCCDEHRREKVRAHPTLNGIDYLEVEEDETDPSLPKVERPRRLHVFLLNKNATHLTEENFQIEGGVRREVSIVEVNRAPLPKQSYRIVLRLNQAGDFSRYTLRLVKAQDDPSPPANFDPRLSSIDFSFHLSCEGDVDCREEQTCPSPQWPAPNIDYLAKDYGSFRRLMLERLALTAPALQERNPADLGVALVELFAYVGDRLSYQQDAIATEAYLETARRRTSVRRHAKLVDYTLDEGQNARAFVQIEVLAQHTLPQQALIISRTRTEAASSPIVNDEQYHLALHEGALVFETLHPIHLYEENNRFAFYDWEDERCCLPKGATRATLLGRSHTLRPGDVLLLLEERDPKTGAPEDANPAHRHVVRLTRVTLTTDPLNQKEIMEIEWCQEDALPFPLCLWSVDGAEVSAALGNIVLCDHGVTIQGEKLPPVPEPALSLAAARGGAGCASTPPARLPARFRPGLKEAPLTFAAPYSHPRQRSRSAKDALYPSASASAQVWLPKRAAPDWQVRPDLFLSASDDPHFVVEVEEDGAAWLRFGDDEHGRRPAPKTSLEVEYRIGNGAAGNVSAGTLTHLCSEGSGLSADELRRVVARVYNHLPAQGGRERETLAEAKKKIPRAFKAQERAVTPEDFAEIARRFPGVQRAIATFRWTGSWYTIFLTVDRYGGLPVDEPFEKALRYFLERYRLAGYDLEVDAPRYVPLELSLHVCVSPRYLSSHVRRSLTELFSSRELERGRKGLFHPDLWTFGQTVYLSPLIAAAQAVPGVDAVVATKFGRRGTPDNKPLQDGELPLGRLEIAQLEGNASFSERGIVELSLEGGR